MDSWWQMRQQRGGGEVTMTIPQPPASPLATGHLTLCTAGHTFYFRYVVFHMSTRPQLFQIQPPTSIVPRTALWRLWASLHAIAIVRHAIVGLVFYREMTLVVQFWACEKSPISARAKDADDNGRHTNILYCLKLGLLTCTQSDCSGCLFIFINVTQENYK